MASDTYNRVRRRQLERMRRERRTKIAIAIAILVILLIIILTKSCGHKKASAADNETTTMVETTADEAAVQPSSESVVAEEETTSDKFTGVEYPVKSDAYINIQSQDVLSPYVALIDVKNNQIIAGRDCTKKIFPASMTKVMTLVVAVDNLKSMDDTFTMTAEIIDPLHRQEASMAGFAPGEKVTAEDLLYGLILPSGADAAVGISTLVAGSEEEFVKLMNKKCEEIGLKNTHFMNTSGLYDDNHYTTAVEMAMIMEYAMTNETCREILSTYQHTTKKTSEHPDGIPLTSTMFSRMYGNEVEGVNIQAGKTGYTAEAGSCLVSYATRGDDAYVAVTAKASGKWRVIFDDFMIYGNYIPNPPGYTRTQ